MMKTKMKKLNITKEQFNKSRYFKDKYGELEYVSESGKIFKTNKGKVLMFKEHHDPEGFTKNPEIQKLSKKVLSKMRSMRKMLDEWDIPSVSEEYKIGGYRIEITLKAGRDDSFSSIGGGRVLTLYVDTGLSGWGISITADEQITYPYLFRGEDKVIEMFNVFLNQFSRDFDDYIAELDRDEMDNAYTESKKFGKKFNERTSMDPDEAEAELREIGDNDPDSIIWILGDILRGIADNCTEDVADRIINSVNEPKLAQLTMAIYQNISNGRL